MKSLSSICIVCAFSIYQDPEEGRRIILYGCMSVRQQKHWHFLEVLHVTFQLHLVELTPLCTDKANRKRNNGTLFDVGLGLTLSNLTTAAGRGNYSSNLQFPEKERLYACVHVCLFAKRCREQRFLEQMGSFVCRVLQSTDNPNRAPRLDGDRVGKGGRTGLKIPSQFGASTGPPLSSHWMYRTSLSFRPKRVLYLSKRHWRDLMYIPWYRSTISSVGSSIFGTVIGSPTMVVIGLP